MNSQQYGRGTKESMSQKPEQKFLVDDFKCCRETIWAQQWLCPLFVTDSGVVEMEDILSRLKK